MRCYYSILLFSFFVTLSFAEDINIKTIAIISNAKEPGQLLYKSSTIAGGETEPSSIFFNQKNEPCIYNEYNKSIQIYDRQMKYKRSIESQMQYPNFYDPVLTFIDGSIANVNGDIFDERGNLIRYQYSSDSGYNIDQDHSSIFNNYLLTYLYANDSHPQSFLIRRSDGYDISGLEIQRLQSEFIKLNTCITDSYQLDSVYKLLHEDAIFLAGNRLLARNASELEKYFKIINSNSENIFTLSNDLDDGHGHWFHLRFDAKDNYYIDIINTKLNSRNIIITDKYGNIIRDYTYNYQLYQFTDYTVDTNGDIYTYILDSKNQQFIFYFIENIWDPITISQLSIWRSNQIALSKQLEKMFFYPLPKDHYVKLLNISVTSQLTEPFDKNFYDPLKVFDGLANTGWMEGSSGFGKNDFMEISFSEYITVDFIYLGLGWINPTYFKNNNRIKSIQLIFDDKPFSPDELPWEITFDDIPYLQDFSISQPYNRFKKIRIIIKSVYPTEKWDDTPITEVQFFFKGQKIKIDTSAATSIIINK
jgi:hypothetical protein